MAELFANNGDLDPRLHCVLSDQSLHCLPMSRFGAPVSDGLKREVVLDFRI